MIERAGDVSGRNAVAPVWVDLDGHPRRLLCNYGAIELIEEKIEQGFFEPGVIARVTETLYARDLKFVLWAFLETAYEEEYQRMRKVGRETEVEPNLTIPEIQELLMHRQRIGKARNAVLQAWLAAWPDEADIAGVTPDAGEDEPEGKPQGEGNAPGAGDE